MEEHDIIIITDKDRYRASFSVDSTLISEYVRSNLRMIDIHRAYAIFFVSYNNNTVEVYKSRFSKEETNFLINFYKKHYLKDSKRKNSNKKVNKEKNIENIRFELLDI